MTDDPIPKGRLVSRKEGWDQSEKQQNTAGQTFILRLHIVFLGPMIP